MGSKQRYIMTAIEAGCPPDQIQNFYDNDYVAQPKQLLFHAAARLADNEDGAYWILIGGARGPGKTYGIMAQLGLDDCQRLPGLKALFLRKIQKAAGESLEDLVYKLFRTVEHDYSVSSGRVRFGNGSRIVIGGFKDESDIDKYMGIDYDVLAIEEATQLSREKAERIRGSVRTNKKAWRPRIYMSTNPGGIGHAFVKQEFVIPYREKNDRHKFVGGITKFIPANYKDNKFLDKDYVEYLEALPGDLGKAWRDGDWDVFEGMAFPQWNYEEHVIDPFEIPEDWVKWIGVDGGYAKPYCSLWATQDPYTGRIYIYREHYKALLTDTSQAQYIKSLTADEVIRYRLADPALWQRKNVENKVTTTADEYRKQGVILTKGDNDRLSGKRKVDRLLGYLPDGLPGIQIFSSCHNLIRTLPSLPYDEHRQEDVDTDAEDHAYDAMRYLLSRVDSQPKRSRRKQAAPFTEAGAIL